MLVNCSRTLIKTWRFANFISVDCSEPLSILTVTKQESTQKPGPSPPAPFAYLMLSIPVVFKLAPGYFVFPYL